VNFVKIGTVQAVWNSSTDRNYSFTDKNIGTQYPGQKVFYRLKMIDKDNSFKMSPVQKVSLDKTTNWVSIYPNPAKDIVNVFTTDINRIIMIDVAGHILRDVPVQTNWTVARTAIDVSKMPAWVYVLRLVGTDKVVRSEKFIISK
jgi:hypothetical protein